MKSRVWIVCLSLGLLAGCEAKTNHSAGNPAQATAGSQDDGSRVARGQLRFVEGFGEGIAEAERTGKPMMLFFTAEWCHFCHQMAADAFMNPQVVGLSERFVCVLIDADGAPDVCRQFQVAAFPTIQFTSADGLPLNRIEGKRPGHQVMMAMQAALQTVARRNSSSLPTQR